jgi:hypothetical protein
VVEATIALVRDSLGPGAALVSFSELLEDDARAQARESARRWASNQPLGPLDGVPVAVKNALDVRGYHNTEGTKFLGQHKGPSESDSAAVHRLRSAGAIIVGMTCMHEIGMGVTGQSIHEGRGPHRNPHNLSNYAGGSSSGRYVSLCPLSAFWFAFLLCFGIRSSVLDFPLKSSHRCSLCAKECPNSHLTTVSPAPLVLRPSPLALCPSLSVSTEGAASEFPLACAEFGESNLPMVVFQM